MDPSTLSLCKKEYCIRNNLRNVRDVEFKFLKLNSEGEGVFSVSVNGSSSEYKTLTKKDLNPLSGFKTLSIKRKELESLADVSKSMIANWVNSKTGDTLHQSDIDYVIVNKNDISVIISANSMRFKNGFNISLI